MYKHFYPFYPWMFEGPIFDDAEVFKTLSWLIRNSCFEDTFVIVNKMKVELKRGETFIESRKKAAEALNITENRYRTILKILQKTGEIEINSTNKYTIIKLIKWKPLEPKAPTNHQQSTNRPPRNHQQTTDSYININNKNNINKINNINTCVPTPKATKFRNFEPSGEYVYDIEWEKENIKRQMEKYGSSD